MDQDRKHYDLRLGQLRQEMSQYLDVWRDIADYVAPWSARFLVDDRASQGSRKGTKIFDNTATIATRTLSSGFMSGATNPARPWFQLRTPDADLNEFQAVKEWLDAVRRRMMEAFLQSNLYSVLPSVYEDLGLFGTAAFAEEEGSDEENILRFIHFPMGSYRLGTGYSGRVDSCYREYKMQASQLVKQFGEKQCSAAVRSAYEAGTAQWFNVVHAVEPNAQWDDQRLSSKFKEIRSVYYEKGSEEHAFLRESGFDEFPIMAPRWRTTGEDIYGIGPGHEALSDIKGLQVMQKKKLKAIEKMVDPPMTAPPALKTQPASTLPGAVTFIDSSSNGQKFEAAHEVNLRIDHLMAELQETQKRIKDTFFTDLFLMIANDQRSNITAFEIAARQEEKLLALGPVYLKLNDELLDPLIDRTFNIMMRKGHLPTPPPELQGIKLDVEYISVMAQAMKAVGVSNLERLLSFVGGSAQAFPQILDKLNADEIVDSYADMMGVPPKLINDKKTVQKIRDARAQQDRAAQAMQMAQQGAETANKLANAPLGDSNALAQIMQRMQPQGAPA